MTKTVIGKGGWRFARGEHECFGCGAAIQKDVRYYADVRRVEGKPVTFHFCERCYYAMLNAAVNGRTGDIDRGSLVEHRLNSKFRQWWRELMETRRHEYQLLMKIQEKL